MCGIAGYIAIDGADQSQLKLISALMAIDIQSRGNQAWGTLDNEGVIVKDTGAISAGITLPLVMPSSYVMHTRFGTHGGNTPENAHPFRQGEVVGVHNGVIANHDELNKKYGREFAVDSQHIFQHINDGMLGLDDIQGYGALVYRFQGHWFAGTFNHGQLEIANTPLGKIYASTQESVRKSCRFAGVEILNWDVIPDNSIYELTTTQTFKRFDLKASGTTAKWDDAAEEQWWKSSKKNRSDYEGKLVRRIFASSMGVMRPLLPPPPPTYNATTGLYEVVFDGNESTETGGVVLEMHPPRTRDEILEEMHTLNSEIVKRIVDQVEHDETSTGLECGHCYSPCLPELHYVNVDGEIVCPECARSSYAFIAPDEYYSNVNGGRFQVNCGLCNTTEMEPIINLVNEDLMICKDCFEIQFNTKGLTKVTTALVH